MHLAFAVATTIVLPIASILIEYLLGGGSLLALVGKWFVFWGIGVRLLPAGISQVMRPGFTASTILGIEGKGVEKIVYELGFANIAMGLAGVLTLIFPAWVAPVALIGGLFLGLDGIQHVRNADRSREENTAMVTDFVVAAAAAVYLVAWLASAA